VTRDRERLPNRRSCTTIEFQHANFRFRASLGYFEDGRRGEIFLNGARTGTDLEASARDSAIICSLALQAGVSVRTIPHALTRNADGRASGPARSARCLISWRTKRDCSRGGRRVMTILWKDQRALEHFPMPRPMIIREQRAAMLKEVVLADRRLSPAHRIVAAARSTIAWSRRALRPSRFRTGLSSASTASSEQR
jgi:hypothetical protein